ncbi:expressed conserved protein [Echinococcus multilocularis]|uniref:Expressed conserved protein n=1 Tax=Echinococcus multilocularis TaxID=6211 RepID=A0A068YH19_ECHMU|nr:expressed conserved protein [Echinococcus multilocularis]
MGAFDSNEASGDGNGINSFMTSESPTMGVLRSLTFFVGEVEPRRGIPTDLARRLSAFPVKTIDLEERYRRSEERVRKIKEERVRKVHEHYQHVMSTAMEKKRQRQAEKMGECEKTCAE